MEGKIVAWVCMICSRWISFIHCCTITARVPIIILRISQISLDLRRWAFRSSRIMRIINLFLMKCNDNSSSWCNWIVQRIVIVIQIRNRMAFRRTLRMETLGIIIIQETTTTVTTIIRIQFPHMRNSNNWECWREEVNQTLSIMQLIIRIIVSKTSAIISISLLDPIPQQCPQKIRIAAVAARLCSLVDCFRKWVRIMQRQWATRRKRQEQ